MADRLDFITVLKISRIIPEIADEKKTSIINFQI